MLQGNDLLSETGRRGLVSFSLQNSSNGFILGEYDVCTDEYKTWVAKDPAELRALMRQWFEARMAIIMEVAERKHSERK